MPIKSSINRSLGEVYLDPARMGTLYYLKLSYSARKGFYNILLISFSKVANKKCLDCLATIENKNLIPTLTNRLDQIRVKNFRVDI
jgi:hypothetical protein